MNQEQKIKTTGLVKEVLSNGFFKVVIDGDYEILAHLSGKMRMNTIRVIEDDKVKVEISQYDIHKGRIIARFD